MRVIVYRLLFVLSPLLLVSCSDGLTDLPDATTLDPEQQQPTGIVAAFASSGDADTDGPVVTTDKDDYQPGDTVTITGSGWEPGEAVELHITEEPQMHDDHLFEEVADEDGRFTNRDLLINEDHLGVTFTLTASGEESGEVEWTFTDALGLESLTADPESRTIEPGEDTEFALTIQMNGAGRDGCTATLEVLSGLPDEATVVWDPESEVGVAGTGSPSFEAGITIQTAGDTPADTYEITIQVSIPDEGRGQGCDSGSETTNIDLVVEAAAPSDTEPPAVNEVAAAPSSTDGSDAVTITASISDVDLGDSDITGAEYEIAGDDDWIAMDAADGESFGETEVDVTAEITDFTGLSDGTVDVCVRATDAADNTSDGDACTTFKLDTTPPEVTNVDLEVDYDENDLSIDATIEDTDSDVTSATFQVFDDEDTALLEDWQAFDAFDADSEVSPTATVDLDDLGDVNGQVTVCVRGEDEFGNESDGTAEDACAAVTIDRSPPAVSDVDASPTLTDGSDAVTITASISDVDLGDSDITGAEYEIAGDDDWIAMDAADGESFGETEVDVTAEITDFTGLSDGTVDVCVRATDAANNTSDGDDCTSFTLDTAPPEVTNVGLDPDQTNGVSVDVSADVTDAHSDVESVEYRIGSDGDWNAMSSSGGDSYEATIPQTEIEALDEDHHTVCVRATDAAGNESIPTEDAEQEDCAQLTFDETAPQVTGVSASPTPTNGEVQVSVSATLTDNLSGIDEASFTVGSITGDITDGTATIDASDVASLGEDTHTLCVQATDGAGNTSTPSDDADLPDCAELVVDLTDPDISDVSVDPTPTNGDDPVTVSATVTDDLSGVSSVSYSLAGGSAVAMDEGTDDDFSAVIPAGTIGDLSEGSHQICVLASDVAGNETDGTADDCATLVVDKTPPEVSNLSLADPGYVEVNGMIMLFATVDDEATGNSPVESAEFSTDGTTWTPMSTTSGTFGDDALVEVQGLVEAPAEPGVVDVCVRATDVAGNTSEDELDPEDERCIFLAVVDPSGGFVTGGGWIDSPDGAYYDDRDLTGKATFGFVSRYLPGRNTPDGNTQFQFRAGNLSFHSTSYDWLVVSGGSGRAQFKGEGRLNGVPGHDFTLTVIDAEQSDSNVEDLFRIKITYGGETVYDNGKGAPDSDDPPTALGGGSIVIHTGGNGNGRR